MESGRRYSCLHEVVTYRCSGQGTSLTVNAFPYIDGLFFNRDPVPSTRSTSDAVLTLIGTSPNFSARLQILNVTQAVNVSCSTGLGLSTLPLVVFTSKSQVLVSTVFNYNCDDFM